MGVYLNRSVIQIHLHFGFQNERFKQKASSDRIYAKVIAHSIERKFSLFCCGCKICDQDCLMLDEFEKWEMYGLDAIEEAGTNYAVWREFTNVIEILNVPFEKYFTEHLLSLEENPDLMLIESLFQEYQDNQSLIEVLCDLSNPKADPLGFQELFRGFLFGYQSVL